MAHEFVSTWGIYGAGFDRHVSPRGIDTWGDRVAVADAGSHSIEIAIGESSGVIYNYQETPSADAGRFRSPRDVALVNDELFYVADTGNHRISRREAGVTKVWGAFGSALGQFASPVALDVAPGGNVYVADAGEGVVKVFAPDGKFLGTVGEPGSGDGQLTLPVGVAVAADGAVLVSDASGYDIQTFRPLLAATEAPHVSGRAKVGRTLKASPGEWPVPDVDLAFQWLRDGVAVPGATGTSYRLRAADAGRSITVRVTASRADYAEPASATSAAVDVAKVKARVTVRLGKKTVKVGKRAKVTVVVRAKGFGHPTGKVRVLDRGQRIKTVTLRAKHAGKVMVRLGRLDAGKHRIKAVFRGSDQIAKAPSKAKTLRVRR